MKAIGLKMSPKDVDTFSLHQGIPTKASSKMEKGMVMENMHTRMETYIREAGKTM